MEKKHIEVIGMIGGIIALGAIFTPWIRVTEDYWGLIPQGWSAWWSIMHASEFGISLGYFIIAVIGAVMALVGFIGALVVREEERKGPWIIVGSIGGVLLVFSAVWGFYDVYTNRNTFSILRISVNPGLGLYLTLVGGILSLIGFRGLRH